MFLKRPLTVSVIVGIDLTLSVICFKQLWAPGTEAEMMSMRYILFQPFIQLYALMGIWIFSTFFNREENELPERVRDPRTVALFLFFILAPPLALLFLKKGFRLGLILLWGFLDPIKTKYYWGHSYQQLRSRAILLLAVSFVLIFVSAVISKLHGTDDTDIPFFMGGFFYLFIAYLDIRSRHNPEE